MKKLLKNTLFLPTLLLVLNLAQAQAQAQDLVDYYEDAVARYAAGDYKAAEIQLKNALKADPQHLPSRLLLGRTALMLGDPSSAEKELKIALRLGAARDKVFSPLGNAMLLQRKYQAVLDTFTTVNLNTPEAEQVYIFRGRAYLGLYELDAAESSFERAARIAPEGLETLLGKSAVFKARDELEQAELLIDRARELYPDSLEVWFEKGVLRAAQGDTDGALASYNHILEEDPGYYKTRVARGTLYLSLGRTEEALIDLQLVHDNVSSDFNAAFLYAAALRQAGRSEEAKVVLVELTDYLAHVPEEVLRSEPTLLRAVTLLNYLKGDLGQAAVYGSLYISDAPRDFEMGKLVGAIYVRLGQVDSAIETLYPLQRQRPDDVELLLLLGEAHLEKKQYAEASAVLEKAAALAPDNAVVGARLGLGKFGMGQPGEAEDQLLRSFELNSADSVGAGFILAQFQLRKRDTEAALGTVRKLISQQPGNPVLYNLLGAVYIQGKDLESARKAFERASRVAPGFLGGEYNLARLDIREGQYDDARTRLEALLEAQPQSPLVLMALADLELARGDYTKALPWLTKAIALDNKSVEAGVKLVDLLIQNGEDKNALRQGEDLVRFFPRESSAVAALARAQIANGQDVKARANLSKAVTYAGSVSGVALLELADQQVKLQDYMGARKTLGIAANTDRSAEAQAAMIRLELATGNFDDAEAGLANLEKLTGNAAVIALMRGDIRLQQKQYKQALKAYRESFDSNPGTLSAIGVFESNFLLGNHDAAQDWLASWVSAHPEDATARRSLARSRLSTGKRAEAGQGFEQLILDGYGTAEDYSYLARIYQLNGDERASEVAKLALDMDPESAQVLDIYGWILVTEGRASEGLPYLREAVSRDSDLFLRYHLATALNEVGRVEESRRELQAIFRAKQELPWLASAQALYDSLPSREEPAIVP
jgi:putative PEP-CTERM system TPR-repeat lipoprotein